MLNSYNQPVTLSKEQQACVDYKGEKALDLKIQGIAGAGKSLVLMARIMKCYKENPGDSFAFFTYNNTLATSVKEMMEINHVPLDNIHISTLDSYLNEVYQRLAGHMAGNAVYEKAKYKFMEQAMDTQAKKAGVRTRLHSVDVRYWVDEVRWMKERNVGPHDFEEYLKMKRTGRGKDIRVTNQDKGTIFQFYREYTDILTRKKLFEWEDRYLYVAKQISRIPEDMKFNHIYIDEAQDQTLTKMIGLTALKKSNGRSDITIAMDMNQQIYGKQMPIPGLQASTKKLTKTYRCSIQIDALAESLRIHNDEYMSEEDKNPHIVPVKEGPVPIIHQCANAAEEKRYVLNLIKSWQMLDKNITIGILSPTNAQNDIYSEWLSDAMIKHEKISREDQFSVWKPGVKVATVFSAKGMEFTHVIIPQFQEGKFPLIREKQDEELILEEVIRQRSLAYVAMTRAMKGLAISYSGVPSRFIAEMDKRLYKFEKPDIKPAETRPAQSVAAGTVGTSKPVYTRIGAKTEPKAVPKAAPQNSSAPGSMKDYFKSKGLEVIDKREHGGCLWVVGDEAKLKPYLQEVAKLYNAYGKFGAGRATSQRRGWFTRCKR